MWWLLLLSSAPSSSLTSAAARRIHGGPLASGDPVIQERAYDENGDHDVDPSSVEDGRDELSTLESPLSTTTTRTARQMSVYDLVYPMKRNNDPYFIPLPEFRYIQWNSLTEEFQADAIQLNYDNSTWNTPGTAALEELSWYSIASTQPNAIPVLQRMGFDQENDGQEVWDCFVNHYVDYDWDELAEEGLEVFARMLGWTEESWENDGPLPVDGKSWQDLTDEQQEGALRLCYFQELWDGMLLTSWPEHWQEPLIPSGIRRWTTTATATVTTTTLLLIALFLL